MQLQFSVISVLGKSYSVCLGVHSSSDMAPCKIQGVGLVDFFVWSGVAVLCAQQVLHEQWTEVQLWSALRPELVCRARCYVQFCSDSKLFSRRNFCRNFCSKRFIQYKGVGPALGIVYAFLTIYHSTASSTP